MHQRLLLPQPDAPRDVGSETTAARTPFRTPHICTSGGGGRRQCDSPEIASTVDASSSNYRDERVAASRNRARNARVRGRLTPLDDAMHHLQVLLELVNIARGEIATRHGAHTLRTLLVRLLVNRQPSLGEERLKASRKGARVGLDTGVKLRVKRRERNNEFVLTELLLLGERQIAVAALVGLRRLRLLLNVLLDVAIQVILAFEPTVYRTVRSYFFWQPS